MGVIESSGLSNVTWLKVNLKTSSLLFKSPGQEEYRKISGFVGNLHGMDYVHKKANLEKDIPEHWVFQFQFQDGDDNYAMEMKEGNSVTNNFINSLLSIPLIGPGQKVYFRVYEKDGNTNMFMAASEEKDAPKLDWAYPWDQGEKWFKGVPKPVETSELDDKGRFKKDFSGVTAFWREQFLTKLYPAFNEGNMWAAPRDPEKTRVISANLTSRAGEWSPAMFEERWKSIVDYLVKNLASQEDRNEVLATIRGAYINKGGKKNISNDGTIQEVNTGAKKAAEAPAANDEPQLDDLPF